MKRTAYVGFVCAVLGAWSLRGDESRSDLEAWIPDNVVGYLKVRGLASRLDSILESGLVKELERLGLLGSATQEGPGKKFYEGLEQFRAATGLEPLGVVRRGFGREVVGALRFGFAGPEGVLLTRAASSDDLEDLLRQIRRGVGEHLGQVPEGERTTYREYAVETIDKASIVVVGEVLIVANSSRLLESVLDLASGNADGSVLSSPIFAAARRADTGGGLSTLVVRPQYIPGYRIPAQTDNAVASLLLQGIFGCLEKSDLLTFDLDLSEAELSLDVRSALPAGGIAARYGGFFPSSPSSPLAGSLRGRGLLAAVSIRRDLAKWWAERETLLVANAVGGLLQFEQIMGILFGGKSFGEEVLPQFGDEILLVARNQQHEDLASPPSPSLPGFAVVFAIRGAAEFANSLVGAFQTVVGLMNADRAQKKQGDGIPMLLTTEQVARNDLYTVKLNAPPAQGRAELVHNFTPSFAVVGERVIISSSKELARLIIEEVAALGAGDRKDTGAANETSPPGHQRAGDSLTIEGAQLLALLEENEEFLVADAMLKKGQTKAEAEGEIRALTAIARQLRDLRLGIHKADDWAGLRVRLRLTPSGGTPPAEKAASAKAKEARL